MHDGDEDESPKPGPATPNQTTSGNISTITKLTKPEATPTSELTTRGNISTTTKLTKPEAKSTSEPTTTSGHTMFRGGSRAIEAALHLVTSFHFMMLRRMGQ